MAFSELELLASLPADQRPLFAGQFARVAKSRSTATLLTLLLGGVGAHRFYLDQPGLGVLYLAFCWSFIPAIVALFELVVIGQRVDEFNEARAKDIAAGLRHAFGASTRERMVAGIVVDEGF